MSFSKFIVNVGANISDFQKKMTTVSKTLDKEARKIGNVGSTLTKNITAPVAAAYGASTKAFADFETSLNKVSTVADENVKSMKNISAEVLNTSNKYGIAATGINEATYQMISATGNTANALTNVGVSVKAAEGGFTDVTTAVDGLTTVTNAYGLKGTAAMQMVSDQMLTAQNLGKTTFGEMAQSIGNVIPIAANLGIETDELFASMATLTKNGIQTSQSVTGLKAAYSNILKPTAEAAKLAGSLGLEFNSAHLKSVGWAQFLQEVKEKTGGSSEAMAKLFGSTEALNAVTVLTTSGAKDFANAIVEMGNAAGATQAAYDKMNQGTADTWQDTMIEIQNLGIEIGQVLAPTVNDFLGKISEMVKWFKSLDDSTKENIIKFGLYAAALGPIMLATSNTIRTTSALVTTINMAPTALKNMAAVSKLAGVNVGKAFGLMKSGAMAVAGGFKFLYGVVVAHPIILVVMAIVAVLWLLYKNSDLVIAKLKSGWEMFQAVIQAVGLNAKRDLQNIVKDFWETIDKILEKLEPFVKFLPESWQDTFEKMNSSTDEHLNAINQKMNETTVKMEENAQRINRAFDNMTMSYSKAVDAAELSGQRYAAQAEKYLKDKAVAAADQAGARYQAMADAIVVANEVIVESSEETEESSDKYFTGIQNDALETADAFEKMKGSITQTISDINKQMQALYNTRKNAVDSIASKLKNGTITKDTAQYVMKGLFSNEKVEVPEWISQPTNGVDDPRIEEYKKQTVIEQVNINVKSPAEAVREIEILDKQLATQIG
jgi:TP901 family phage tail tape measure protein